VTASWKYTAIKAIDGRRLLLAQPSYGRPQIFAEIITGLHATKQSDGALP
jgi:hypothetical protein